jgi:hypothetical protein
VRWGIEHIMRPFRAKPLGFFQMVKIKSHIRKKKNLSFPDVFICHVDTLVLGYTNDYDRSIKLG